MKKIVILTVLLLISGFARAADAVETAGNTAVVNTAAADAPGNTPEAQKEKVIITYDVFKHIDNSNNIFLGISALSLGMGVIFASNSQNNDIMLGMGIQTIIWGGAETALYLYNKNFGAREYNAEKARKEYVEMSGWHAVFDLAVMAGGGCIALFGDDPIKGYGIGMMVQGAMLATYDGINFFIASNPQDVKDWGMGVGYNFKLAGR